MYYALFVFIAMPIIEIALPLRVGEAFGWAPTLLIVIATAILGSAMLRQQGLATLNKAKSRMDSGEMPAQQMLEGVLIMIGGVLLLTPGFVTDAFGFTCLIPITRQWLASKLSSRAITGFSVGVGGVNSARSPGAANDRVVKPPQRGGGPRSGDIIDGDFERIDKE